MLKAGWLPAGAGRQGGYHWPVAAHGYVLVSDDFVKSLRVHGLDGLERHAVLPSGLLARHVVREIGRRDDHDVLRLHSVLDRLADRGRGLEVLEPHAYRDELDLG